MSNKDNNGLALFAGILLGGIVGAAAGILFAPASGEETRKVLRKKAEKLSKEVSEKAEKLSSEVQKKAKDFNEDSLEPLARKVRSKFRTEVGDLRKSARKTASRLVKKI